MISSSEAPSSICASSFSMTCSTNSAEMRIRRRQRHRLTRSNKALSSLMEVEDPNIANSHDNPGLAARAYSRGRRVLNRSARPNARLSIAPASKGSSTGSSQSTAVRP